MKVKTQIRIEVTPEQFELITKLAKDAGISRNRYIIEKATQGTESAQITLKPVEVINTIPKQEKPVKQAVKWKPYGKQDAVK